MKNTANTTLFEQIGGMAAVEAAVEIFYAKVLADDRIAHFFRWIDMRSQIGKQKAFLAYAFGAPTSYTGKTMKGAHAHLVDKGLNDSHFDAVMDHLKSTMKELKIESNLIDEVEKITERTRHDVLGR